MDTRIPKPSGLRMPTKISKPLGDFSNFTKLPEIKSVPDPTVSKAFAGFRFNNRAKSPDHPSSKQTIHKLRKSKSSADLTENMRRPLKRFEPALDTIHSKRQKTGLAAISKPTLKAKPVPAAIKKVGAATQAKLVKQNTVPTTTTTANVVSSVGASKKATTAASAKVAIKRIPPYDYKARYADLVDKHKALKEKFDCAQDSLEQFEKLTEEHSKAQTELTQVKNQLTQVEGDAEQLRQENSKLTLKNTALTNSLQSSNEELVIFKASTNKLTNELTTITAEVCELREKSGTLQFDYDKASSLLIKSQEQLFDVNIERKKLHNQVLDLRGNIRVFCRVRPSLPSEADRQQCGWNFVDETALEVFSNDLNSKQKGPRQFEFDYVFSPNSQQEDIFEMVSPLIQSALDGYNICIFAYGQTGSGKTFTMDGVQDSLGVIPRTVNLLFDSIEDYKLMGWEYKITASFLEIYNEVFYDMLNNDTPKNIEIRMVNAKSQTDIYVSNLIEEEVDSAFRLRQLMNIARSNRATAATVGNERSSRSHAVTRIQLVGTHAKKNETCTGTINLVDLAGSESPKTSIRMEETKNINRSLSELSNVILALVEKNQHIPYRNSKLTHLLMPCLGGNSKTLMFVNVAPIQDCFNETEKSLRFAAQVKSCKLKSKKNKHMNNSNIF